MKLDALLLILRRESSGHVASDSEIAGRLEQLEREQDPLYIKILSGIGAWLSAFFFIAFLGGIGLIDESRPAFLFWGLVFTGSALALRFFKKEIYWVQLALAFASVGNGLLLAWGVLTLEDFQIEFLGALAVSQAFLCLALYVPYKDPVYRFLAPLVFFLFAILWIIEEKSGPIFIHLLLALQLAITGMVLAAGLAARLLKPLAYSCAIALLGTFLLADLHLHVHISLVLWRVILVLSLIGLFFWASDLKAGIKDEWLLVAIAGAAFLGWITNPGLLAALGLLVLGYKQGDQLLLGLGLLFLPVFMVTYYYDLRIDLAYKSWVLIGSGLILLAARALLKRRAWTHGGAS